MTLVRHLTASGIVFNPDDQVLLVHHNKIGLWLHPGGHLEPNEDPAEAAVREVCEETGVEATLLHAARFNHPATIAHATPYAILEMQVRDARFGIHRHIDFVYVLSSRVRRTSAQLDEVQNVQWVPIADVGQLETPPELPSLISEAAEWAKLWTGHRQVHACPRVPGSVGGQVAAERAGRRG